MMKKNIMLNWGNWQINVHMSINQTHYRLGTFVVLIQLNVETVTHFYSPISHVCLTHLKHLTYSKRHTHSRYMVIHPCNGVSSAWTSGSWCEWTPGGWCRWVSRSQLRAQRRAVVTVPGRCAQGCRWKRRGSGRWGHPAWAGTGARWRGASAIATPHWTPTRRAQRITST